MGCAPSASKPHQPHVVLIGCNLAGIEIAMLCEKKGIKLTAIEPKDRVYVNYAGLRASVRETFDEKVFVPYDRLFDGKNGCHIIRGLAKSIDADQQTVTYSRLDHHGMPVGEGSISYDFLIIATGALYGYPMKSEANMDTTRQRLAEIRSAIRQANDIVVVGGGPTAIEYAGEIKDAHPNKQVTIAHGREALLSGPTSQVPRPFQDRILQECVEAGITVLLGTQVQGIESMASVPGVKQVVPGIYSGKQTLTVSSSERAAEFADRLHPDLVIVATGPHPNTTWLRAVPAMRDCVDSFGFIRTEATYQIHRHPRMFAMGDCAGTPDVKAGWVLPAQAAIIVDNIGRLAAAARKIEITNKSEGRVSGKGKVAPDTSASTGDATPTYGSSVSAGIITGSSTPNVGSPRPTGGPGAPRRPSVHTKADPVAQAMASGAVRLRAGKPQGFGGMLAVPVGRNHGAGYTVYGITTGFARFKATDLFTSQVAGKLRYVPDEVVTANGPYGKASK